MLFSSQAIKCWTTENNDAELNGLPRSRMAAYGMKPSGKELTAWKDQARVQGYKHKTSTGIYKYTSKQGYKDKNKVRNGQT
jgi:hypothetical protein